ncbi:hypothetical protein GCM10027598_58700 [Amycolatopsis oliviviridis]
MNPEKPCVAAPERDGTVVRIGKHDESEVRVVGQRGQKDEPAGESGGAFGLFGVGMTGGLPDHPAGMLVPALELAARLEYYVAELIRVVPECPDRRMNEERLDLLVGLCSAADALRSSERREHEQAEYQLRSALALLRGVDPGKFIKPLP